MPPTARTAGSTTRNRQVNPKSESRNPKQIPRTERTKSEPPDSLVSRWGFDIRICFGFRDSAFGFHWNENVATYPVTFVTDDREVRVEVADDQYLLDAARGAGLELP